jgi:NTP pyrophosphatase (non-canonical NTP hydrolase)
MTETEMITVDDVRRLTRDERQWRITTWARAAFGDDEATGLAQRGVRLLEEAIEAFQACGGDEEIAHKLVAFVFARPSGKVGQELGGVAVTVLALAAAAGLSADIEECREISRVLNKPLAEFTERNASKNAAGFLIKAVGKDAP